jgi:hypothetical protein
MGDSAKRTERTASRLRATHSQEIVKFWSPFEEGSTTGYVLDIGPEFFLLLLIDDDMRFNGFQCLRLRDVRKLQAPAEHASFYEAALRARNESIEKKPRVRLDNVSEILRSANKAFPLVTIHREKVNPDVCHIGRITRIDESKILLLEIDPDAVWDTEPTEYRLKEITRVDFGGGYEEALFLVGGAPKITKPKRGSHKATAE